MDNFVEHSGTLRMKWTVLFSRHKESFRAQGLCCCRIAAISGVWDL